jgi:hypothetical protein
LARAGDGLSALLRASETEIASLTRAFERLAGQTHSMLGLAAAIVACIEGAGVSSVLPRVQTLGAAAVHFVEARLNATEGILETVSTEKELLRLLSTVIRSQSVVALKTRVLTTMTNVEVGRLGDSGAGFQHLATELAKFSVSLSEDTDELVMQTDARKLAIDTTRRVLMDEMPHLAAEFARIDVNLGEDLKALQSGLTRLCELPTHFEAHVSEIARQIAGVVAAVQSHDITRQQIEHVQEALRQISSSLYAPGGSTRHAAQERLRAHAGVTIQIYQMRHIRETVAGWISQISGCVSAILKVSASDLLGVGPQVLEQEREISAKLAHIELLEDESKSYSRRIRSTVGEHASLVQLIDQQVKKALTIGQLLHLLSLNSIVEASRLGARANAILEIGNGISELSIEWRTITSRSEQAMQQILELVERIGHLMETFSETGDQNLRQARAQMREGLGSLRTASEFASMQTRDVQLAVANMQAMSAGISRSGDLLAAAYAGIDPILVSLQAMQLQLQTDGNSEACDTSEMERTFSASYTTEVEREVMQAALRGAALPSVRRAMGGNSVELF